MAQLHGQIETNRMRTKWGLDFTPYGAGGSDIKFYSGATLGANPGTTGEWQKGILVRDTLSAGTYTGDSPEWKGKYGSVFTIEGNTTSLYDGHTNGAALRVDFTREAAYTHAGGSEDIACRINATNYAALASGGMRALNIEAINRTGIAAKLQGALITAHQRNTGGYTVGMYGLRVVSKNRSPSVATGYQHALEVADESDGVQPALNSIVWIEKQSNSYTAATRAAIEIVNNCNTSYAKVITHGLYFKCGATNSNITYALGFDSADYTDGAYDKGSTITMGNLYGAIKVWIYDQVFYIPCYETAS